MGDALPYVNLGTGVLVAKIVGGEDSTCIVASAPSTHVGGVKCWGNAYDSQLGQINDNGNIGIRADQMGDFLPWVPLGTVSGGLAKATKSPSKAAGRVLADVQVGEAVRAQEPARRALLEEAHQERRKLQEERRAAHKADDQQQEQHAHHPGATSASASALRGSNEH